MGVANAYLTQVKNLNQILAAVREAQAPERFTHKFFVDLGFKSTNDRLIITVFKALGFIDEFGVPRQRYFDYLDDEKYKQVLADGIREAYTDLFKVNNKAHERDQNWVKNKLKTLTQGSKSDGVLSKMAMTFVALCKVADFSSSPPSVEKKTIPPPQEELPIEADKAKTDHHVKGGRGFGLAYNINIELPAVRDQAVYDAIFKSLKDNLL